MRGFILQSEVNQKLVEPRTPKSLVSESAGLCVARFRWIPLKSQNLLTLEMAGDGPIRTGLRLDRFSRGRWECR